MSLRFMLAVACWCLSVAALHAEDRERVFHRALDTFDAARSPDEFRAAARLFEAVLDGGIENGAVLYNLGNAHFRAGDYGRAIAAYRRALRLRPRDPYLRANLQAALEAAPGGRAEADPPWWKRVFFWHATLAQQERLFVAAGAWSLLFLLALVRLWRAGGSERTAGALRGALAFALLVALLASVSAVLGDRDEYARPRGVVLAETPARKGNGESYEPAFDQPLKQGAEFEVLDRRGGWVHLRLPEAGEGWLPESSVVTY
ncbi:MAG: tetratricopeptide repeat protein [Planctomycetes bacterium]|nr:tetratricopeptide repeat protein [Planctomycetota bacterium]